MITTGAGCRPDRRAWRGRAGRRRRSVSVLAAGALSAGWAAIGASLVAPNAASASASASQTLAASRHALASVAVFTANGYISDGAARMGFLIRSAERGNAANGRFSSSSKAAFGFVGSYQFVRIAATFYLDGNSHFWLSAVPTLTRPELAALQGKWIKLPSNEVRSIATITGAMTNPSRLSSLIGTDATQAGFQFGPAAVLHGQRALTVRTATELVYLSATAPHLPIEYVDNSTHSKTLLELGYPTSLSIVPPPVSST